MDDIVIALDITSLTLYNLTFDPSPHSHQNPGCQQKAQSQPIILTSWVTSPQGGFTADIIE